MNYGEAINKILARHGITWDEYQENYVLPISSFLQTAIAPHGYIAFILADELGIDVVSDYGTWIASENIQLVMCPVFKNKDRATAIISAAKKVLNEN